MGQKLLDSDESQLISPLIDVVANGMAAIFIVLMVYMILVRPAEERTPEPLRFLDTSLPRIVRGLPFTWAPVVVGGRGPRTFTIKDGGTLPPWLHLDAPTGTLGGTAPADEDADGVGTQAPVACTLLVTDGDARVERALSFEMAWPQMVDRSQRFAILLADGTLPEGRVGASYQMVLGSIGSVGPVTWRIVDGRLPRGLELDAQGRVAGTPDDAGDFRFMAEASYGDGAVADGDRRMAWRGRVCTLACSLRIHRQRRWHFCLPPGQEGEAYQGLVRASGLLTGERLRLETDTDSGLAASHDTGEITGVPRSAGRHKVRYAVHQADAVLDTGTADILVLPRRPSPQVPEVTVEAWVGRPISFPLPYRGLVEPVRVHFQDPLPDGLEMSGTRIVGTPRNAGKFTIRLHLEDARETATPGTVCLRISPEL